MHSLSRSGLINSHGLRYHCDMSNNERMVSWDWISFDRGDSGPTTQFGAYATISYPRYGLLMLKQLAPIVFSVPFDLELLASRKTLNRDA